MLNKEVKEYLSNIGKEESYLETNMAFDYFEEKLKESIPYCWCVDAVKSELQYFDNYELDIDNFTKEEWIEAICEYLTGLAEGIEKNCYYLYNPRKDCFELSWAEGSN